MSIWLTLPIESILSTVLLISGLVLTVSDAESYQRFDGHQVYRAIATSEEQLALLKSVEAEGRDGILFWTFANRLNTRVDVMVSPEEKEELLATLDAADISYESYIEDVQTLIDNENPEIQRNSQLRVDETSFNWTAYHRLDVIYAWLDELAETYPDSVELITYGTSYEGRPLRGIKISFGEDNPGIFLEGGIHAREWITPATVTYLINEILEPTNVVFSLLARSYTWFMFPVANPDGYEYTHETNRMWRKTRRPYDNDCWGADPNRNWDYYWLTNGGASNDSCAETYAGPEPFSEVEVKALADYMASVREEFHIYLSIHSYSQLILLPYGYTYDHLGNYEDAMLVGTKAAEALAKRYGTQYTVGATAETIYVASGVSTDYVKGVFNTDIVYCYELRDQGTYGFLLPAEQIVPTALEFIDSLIALIGETRALGYPASHVDQLVYIHRHLRSECRSLNMFSKITIIVLFVCFAISKSEPYTRGKNEENESEGTFTKLVATWETSNNKGWFKIPDNLKSAMAEGWTEIKGGSPSSQIVALGYISDPRLMVMYSKETGLIVGYRVSFPANDVANVPIDYNNHDGVSTKILNGEKYFGGTVFLIENPKGNRQIWVERNSTNYDYIPNEAALIPSKTQFRRKKCLPTLADPQYYAINTTTDCSNISPWSVLIRNGIAVGIGYQAIGTATAAKERTWWEKLTPEILKVKVPDAPECLKNGANKYGVISLHIWFIEDPWNIKCSKENLPVSNETTHKSCRGAAKKY